jgi:hypothetical protein
VAQGNVHPVPIEFISVETMQNVFAFTEQRGGVKRTHRAPLDDVEAVWEGKPGEWQIKVRGYLDSGENKDRYVSRPSSLPYRAVAISSFLVRSSRRTGP